jgi:pyrroloquinoline quinone (PQQ) biosynthesis protein C
MNNQISVSFDSNIEMIQRHLFVKLATSERLSKDQLERWIFCAGRESRSFPRLIEGILGWSKNEEFRTVLRENLQDELGAGDPLEAHFMHYLRLLRELGISERRFEDYRAGYGVSAAVGFADRIGDCGRESLALGYMLINEGMTPIIYRAVERGLKRFYTRLDTAFFDLHVAGDAQHVAKLSSLVERASSDVVEDVVYGIEVGERAMALLLDEALGFVTLKLSEMAS